MAAAKPRGSLNVTVNVRLRIPEQCMQAGGRPPG
jgi:hypothetical protein